MKDEINLYQSVVRQTFYAFRARLKSLLQGEVEIKTERGLKNVEAYEFNFKADDDPEALVRQAYESADQFCLIVRKEFKKFEKPALAIRDIYASKSGGRFANNASVRISYGVVETVRELELKN